MKALDLHKAGSSKVVFRNGASAIALLIAAAATPAFAQETAADAAKQTPADPAQAAQEDAEQGRGEPEMVIVGLRSSIANAQTTKRNADTFVDSLSASDIGALPDRSIAEALQRVPGVSISRFAAGNDPSRFNTEGSAVLIRGLNKTRTEFNGRDSFSANVSDGRGLSFEDVTPEITAGVDVYKNQTADMIEGAIAGTINIRTRLPFDVANSYFSASIDGSYGDLRREFTPTVSAVLSKRWTTGIGDIGILLNFAYSKLKTRVDGVLLEGFFTNETGLIPGRSLTVPDNTEITRQDYDRTRQGRSAALQWRSPDEAVELTLQYFYSKGNETGRQRNAYVDGNQGNFRVYPGTTLELDGNNVVAGTFIEPNGYAPAPFTFPSNVPYPTNDVQPFLGPNFLNQSRVQSTERTTADYSAHLKWNVTDRLKLTFDAQYIDSHRSQTDFTVAYLNKGTYSFSGLGGNAIPNITIAPPYPGAPTNYFENPANYLPFTALDHIEDIPGREYAGRFDLDYDVNSDWLDSVQAGLRVADYDQTARWSIYNWGVINPFWSSDADFLPDNPGLTSELVSINNFAHTGRSYPAAIYPSFAALEQYTALANSVAAQSALQSVVSFSPRWYPVAQRPGTIGGYTPAEINRTAEQDRAGYVRFNLLGDLFGAAFKANVGVRYVNYENSTDGGVSFSNLGTRPIYCTGSDPSLSPEANARLRQTDARCFVSASDYAFANGGSQVLPGTRSNYSRFLPSANIRLDLRNDMFLRFAVALAVSRPGLGFLRNYSTVNAAQPRGLNAAGTPVDTIAACANVPIDMPLPSQCIVASAILQNPEGGAPYNANSVGNPRLRPEESLNFDLSWEWYFAKDGSLTVGGFYKSLSEQFQQGQEIRSFTNNGVTRDVVFQTLQNGDRATIKGFEIAYQQFYTFLPGLLSGLGFQGNYTYISSDGTTSANYGVTAAGGIGPIAPSLNLPLTNLSTHNINLVGIYAKDWFEGRVAYNWRSSYLLTQQDSVAPQLPIYAQAYGQLDASIFFTIAKHFKLGLQGVNLTDSITRTTRTTSATDPTNLPRGWFSSDRRFSAVLRATF